MRKAVIFVSVLLMTAWFTGCGDDPAPKAKLEPEGTEKILTENILTEEIQTEEILVEEIHTEPIRVDPIRVTTWENADIKSWE